MEEENNDLIKIKKPDEIRKTYIILTIIVIGITLIDQIIKFIAIKTNYVDVIPDFLNIHIAENRNGTYGIGSSSTLSYILTNLIVIAVLLKFILSQNEFIDTKLRVLLTFIIAGGFSNTIDRIFRGYVVEFIDFKFLPVLNLADIFIIIGWFSFIAIFTKFTISEFRNNKEKRKSILTDQDNLKSKLTTDDKKKRNNNDNESSEK